MDIDVPARAGDFTVRGTPDGYELDEALTLEDNVERSLTILFDEPTSVLTRADVDVLSGSIRALEGLARASSSCRTGSTRCLDISDRVDVKKDGEVVAGAPCRRRVWAPSCTR